MPPESIGWYYCLMRLDERLRLCSNFTNNGLNNISIAKMENVMVIGRSQRKLSSPSLIINARRRFSSIKPPRMKPSRGGARGKFAILSAIAAIAINSIMKTSIVLKDTKYTPVMEKKRIMGSRTVLGTARSLDI